MEKAHVIYGMTLSTISISDAVIVDLIFDNGFGFVYAQNEKYGRLILCDWE